MNLAQSFGEDRSRLSFGVNITHLYARPKVRRRKYDLSPEAVVILKCINTPMMSDQIRVQANDWSDKFNGFIGSLCRSGYLRKQHMPNGKCVYQRTSSGDVALVEAAVDMAGVTAHRLEDEAESTN